MDLIEENARFPFDVKNKIIDNILKLSHSFLASKLIPEKSPNTISTQNSFHEHKSNRIHHHGFYLDKNKNFTQYQSRFI